LINKVLPAEQLRAAAFEMAEKIKRAAPLSLKAIKEGINRGLGGYEYAYETMVNLRCTEDSKEAVDAFLEKRQPKFKGR
jgi:enoyl-CoA hydratase